MLHYIYNEGISCNLIGALTMDYLRNIVLIRLVIGWKKIVQDSGLSKIISLKLGYGRYKVGVSRVANKNRLSKINQSLSEFNEKAARQKTP